MNSKKSTELEQYVKSELKRARELDALMLNIPPKSTSLRPSIPAVSYIPSGSLHRAQSTFHHGDHSHAIPTISGLSESVSVPSKSKSHIPRILTLSATNTMTSDYDCMEGDDWQHYPSVVPSHSYSIVRCKNPEERDRVWDILHRKRDEEQKDDQPLQPLWGVTRCCCVKDVPHRAQDKFILLTEGKEDDTNIEPAHWKPVARIRSLPCKLDNTIDIIGVNIENWGSERKPPLLNQSTAPLMISTVPLSAISRQNSESLNVINNI